MQQFQELEAQDVRAYWADEATDFTPWLADQIKDEDVSQLEDTLGLDLEVVDTEKDVGRYRVDVVAETVDDGRTVVIENQLEKPDHDHLGKSIAYAAGVDADIIVWLSPKFNDEHRDAMEWLNEKSREGIDFFALRIEVWKIGDSEPAVRLNPVEKPSEWKEKAKRSKGELTETQQLQEQFWMGFRDKIESRDTPLRARKPGEVWSEYDNPIGRTGFRIWFKINTVENSMGCELVISDDTDAFQQLNLERTKIESEVGNSLTWEGPTKTRSGKARSKIKIERDAELSQEESWDEYHDWLIEQGELFHEAFYDRIQNL
jgi:hypothetical protein